MSSSAPTMPSPSERIKTGLGGAGNFRRVTTTIQASESSMASKQHGIPIPFASSIGGVGNDYSASEISLISHAQDLIDDLNAPCPHPQTRHYGIGGAGNHVKRHSSLDDTSLYSSPTPRCESRSPSNKSKLSKLKTKIHSQIEARNARTSIFEAWQRKLPTYTQTGSGPDMTYRPRSHRNRLSTSALSYSSEADTLTSRVGTLKERILWRLDRIAQRGLDEGMQSSSPLYARV